MSERDADTALTPTMPTDMASLVERVGMPVEDASTLIESERYSRSQLAHARGLLGQLGVGRGICVFALGSLGRGEASEQSDLDLAVLYDEGATEVELAVRTRKRVVDALRRDFDVAEKTFHAPISLGRLLRNVGGSGDTNETLTYRALILTEGRWLFDRVAADDAKARLFAVYAGGTVSRGRFLSSLANDLHRYYRTLCVDYRFKVEEHAKAWAIRVLKLRHTRKLWHLANLCSSCWAATALDDAQRDPVMREVLGHPPLYRLAHALEGLGGLEHARALFEAHERFLSSLSSEAVRLTLEGLDYERRYDSPIYRSLHGNAERLDAAAEAVVGCLWARCRPFLIRFCVL